MRKHLDNSWTMFSVLLIGIFLLMVSLRPELQERADGQDGPGKKIAIAGHVLTWSSSSVLAFQMVRTVRKHGTHEEVKIHTPKPGSASQPGEPPTE